jgi:hypothetical protein
MIPCLRIDTRQKQVDTSTFGEFQRLSSAMENPSASTGNSVAEMALGIKAATT